MGRRETIQVRQEDDGALSQVNRCVVVIGHAQIAQEALGGTDSTASALCHNTGNNHNYAAKRCSHIIRRTKIY